MNLQKQAACYIKQFSSVRLYHGTNGFGLIKNAHVTRQSYSSVSAADDVNDDVSDAKPFSAIPGPLSLPYLYNLYLIPYTLLHRNNNDLAIKRNKKYGPIIKEQFGPNTSDALVSLFDAADVAKLHRHDGTQPRRVIIESWQAWRDEFGHSRGILIEDRPVWRRMRLLLNKQMLRPRDVASYGDEIGQVTGDFVERIKMIRDPATKAIKNMDKELFYWSLESIGTVIYETRFGGLSMNRSEEMSEFIQAVHDMFRTTAYCFALPRKINLKVIPRLQALQDKSWEIIFYQGQKQIDKKFQEIQAALDEGREIKGFLSTLLASGTMSMKEIYGNISELMAAAVDTTSNSMQWMLYELAQNQDIQNTIRNEVLAIAPRGAMPSYDDIQRMVYLKGFLKEILRLYPVANVITRVTNEDIVLGGYHIPPNVRVMGSSFIIGRNPAYFPNPDKIQPERWLRSSDKKVTHPWAWMAFGFGSRMCIGRRIAELEMHLLTATLLQEFEIFPMESKPNLPATKPLLIPDRPVYVKFVDR